LKKINNQILSFKLGFTNNFLIKLKKGYILVDTSHAKKYNQFLKELRKEKIDVREILYLILTHHHDDHSGFVNKILANSQAKIIIHENAIHLLQLGTHDKRGEHWNWIVDGVLSSFTKLQKHNFPPIIIREKDIILKNNKQKNLSTLGIKGRIITTPGHSNDSISLILNDGNAIIGDTAMNMLNLGETKYRPFFIQDLDKIYQSWKKLIQFGARILHPSHGKAFPIEKLSNELLLAEKNSSKYSKK
jgi:glyoxylase-like metal-dependent hydrolase (beta-lactamase superfamily II)